MGVEEKIRYLVRAATRAEGEGDARVARALRRMAEEALPVDALRAGADVHDPRCCCAD